MAQHNKPNYLFKRIIALIFATIIIVGCFSFVVNYLSDIEMKFEKSFYPLKYSDYVEDACEKYELQPAFVYAIIKTESGFNEKAKSSVGALGLMQIMPDTFRWMQSLRNESLDDSDLFDPQINIDYGCYYLNYLMSLYQDENSVVAAYNAGQTVVSDWLKNQNYSYDGKTLSHIPYEETSNYVQKVENAKDMYIKLYFS